MHLKEAISLIQHNIFNATNPQVWCDLGCGAGLFTNALASLLPARSMIYAIDSNLSAFNKIAGKDDVVIQPRQLDFVSDPIGVENLDGILMANSLHFVKDKPAFLKKIIDCMKPAGRFIIVEYDTERPVSTWVPYPISFQSLTQLFSAAGYSSVTKLRERPSVYHSGNMYSALITG